MTLVDTAAPVTGEEHWTNKGADVKLALWNKRVADRPQTAGTILFVHGSSMASQPTFDLDVPGRTDSSGMDCFAAAASTPGASTWRATAARPRTATTTRRFRRAPTIASRPRQYIQKLRGDKPLAGLRHLVGRAARRRCSPSGIPNWWRGSRSTPWSGPAKASPTLAERSKKLPEFRSRTAARSTAPSCTHLHTRPSRARPTTRRRRVRRRDPGARRLDAERHLCRHVREPAGGRSRPRSRSDHRHARPVRRHRRLRRPDRLLQAAAESGQAVRRDAGIAHAHSSRRTTCWCIHILHSFFTQPAPIYRG